MCHILKVSRSSYYYWITKKPSHRLIRRLELGISIKKVYDWSKGRYGSPGIAKELQMKGQNVFQNLVARIMRNKNLRSVRVRRFKQTTNSKHAYPIMENRLAQNFNTRADNQVWVADITYIKTGEGWVYLTTVIDLFDRKVIGWHMSNNMRASDTVIPALNKAYSEISRTLDTQLVFHSDRGIQYACNQFKDTLKKYKGIL